MITLHSKGAIFIPSMWQVYGVADDRLGEDVAASVILTPGTQLTPLQLQEYCRGKVSLSMVPQNILCWFRISVTRTGEGHSPSPLPLNPLWRVTQTFHVNLGKRLNGWVPPNVLGPILWYRNISSNKWGGACLDSPNPGSAFVEVCRIVVLHSWEGRVHLIHKWELRLLGIKAGVLSP